MGKTMDKIKALSGGDGIDFKPLPTSDRPVEHPRNLKKEKRCKIAKIGLIGIFVLSIIVAVISINTIQPYIDHVQDIESRMGESKASSQGIRSDQSSSHIGLKLYNEERKKNTGNILFSPFSIQSALSMVTLGAKDNTLEQLIQFLSAPGVEDMNERVENLKKSFSSILPTLQSNENYTIETANSVFLNANFEVLETLVKDLETNFQTSFRKTDFSNSQSSASLINGWVEEKTRDKIKNLINPAALNANTMMVLVNALYFKGMWENKFEKNDTMKRTFYVSDTRSVETNFMHQKRKLLVGEYKKRTVLALPYSGDRFTMYLILPHTVRRGHERFFEDYEDTESKKDDDVSVVENELEAELLNQSFNKTKFQKEEVDLLLPSFKIEADLQLKEILQSVGVKAPFSGIEADFSGISGAKNLFLSDAVHKAFIEVNEEGSEAAAATGLIMMTRMMPAPPLQAHFDRPFVFFLRDELTGLFLFQGRVVDPTV
ncbi:leukocyte elastase inhibitor A isoform X3 [Eurytemora carolleeae]|uniref:leukocyte elastase inhibitor A isoform X3 n=1 Tax=Eurytemora carolleeae TaxID=1294199 RepID=UPI000C76BD46|nr:leukocyte elastase inhibitor A isoform X3 [Eurytemora carolleeae]|eukprot:XP_023334855.1 leukocyte elastase inhibitor A-like isoform X3 [Eurytemora affinis]